MMLLRILLNQTQGVGVDSNGIKSQTSFVETDPSAQRLKWTGKQCLEFKCTSSSLNEQHDVNVN